ncbi:bioH [Gossypium arboreum]|uniref:BioH n=1 Tax=Gossypium arboreum TaxID=29729 RepID=A0A0B0MP55_GOSAR|nr:bioH [Gossypium arboreum]
MHGHVWPFRRAHGHVVSRVTKSVSSLVFTWPGTWTCILPCGTSQYVCPIFTWPKTRVCLLAV